MGKIIKLNELLYKDEVSNFSEEQLPNREIPLKVKSLKKKTLTIKEIKAAVLARFGVENVRQLKVSGSFLMATDGMEKQDFRYKSTWEILYRKYVGILPYEENEQGYGCINGINVLKYFKPWQVFGLNPQSTSKKDLKSAYYVLSKKYHPDNLDTGDRLIFEQIENMYQSLITAF